MNNIRIGIYSEGKSRQQCDFFLGNASLKNNLYFEQFEELDKNDSYDYILVVDIYHRTLWESLLTIKNDNDYKKLILFYEMAPVINVFPGLFSHSYQNQNHKFPLEYYFFLNKINKRNSDTDSIFNYNFNEAPKFISNFLGRTNIKGSGRRELMDFKNRKGYVIKDTTSSYPIFTKLTKNGGSQIGQQRNDYLDILNNSFFTFCPSGAGPSSIRIYESLLLGSIPIIFGNDLKLPSWVEDLVIRVDKSVDVNMIDNKLRKYIKDGSINQLRKRAYYKSRGLFLDESLMCEQFESRIYSLIRGLKTGEIKSPANRRLVYVQSMKQIIRRKYNDTKYYFRNRIK